LGADEGTAEGHGNTIYPALGHLEAAERQEFPPEEAPSDESEETE
jgi:hypothetical protein